MIKTSTTLLILLLCFLPLNLTAARTAVKSTPTAHDSAASSPRSSRSASSPTKAAAPAKIPVAGKAPRTADVPVVREDDTAEKERQATDSIKRFRESSRAKRELAEKRAAALKARDANGLADEATPGRMADVSPAPEPLITPRPSPKKPGAVDTEDALVDDTQPTKLLKVSDAEDSASSTRTDDANTLSSRSGNSDGQLTPQTPGSDAAAPAADAQTSRWARFKKAATSPGTMGAVGALAGLGALGTALGFDLDPNHESASDEVTSDDVQNQQEQITALKNELALKADKPTP